MRDKKSPPEEQNTAWEDPDDGHGKTLYVDSRGDEDEIKPIEDELSPPPKSQALMDIQEAGLTPEEAARASEELAAGEKPAGTKADKKARKQEVAKGAARSGAENLVVIARFRWIFLLVLALISVAAWTVEAFISERPFKWESAAWLALTLVFVLPTMKFLRLPTISGLAALFWAGSYSISALFGPPEILFGSIPAALSWAGLLTLIVLWMGVAIWRKLGRYRVIDLLLSLVLIYAALGPVGALVSSISSGAALDLNFSTLGSSPVFLTAHMPWFIWPMTIMVALMLPLCAFFSFWDQFSALRRRGARHGGNFFMALAFIVLLPYAFLSYDQAVNEFPQEAQKIRAIWPAAAQYVQDQKESAAKLSEVATTPPSRLPEATPVPAQTTPEPVQTTAPEVDAPIPAIPPTQPEPEAVVPTDSSLPATPLMSSELTDQSQSTISTTPPQQRLTEDPPADVPGPPQQQQPTLEEKLAATDKRLEQALSRIEELERELNFLKKTAIPPVEEETSLTEEDFIGGGNI